MGCIYCLISKYITLLLVAWNSITLFQSSSSGKSFFRLSWSFFLLAVPPSPASRKFHQHTPQFSARIVDEPVKLQVSVMPDPSGASFCGGVFPLWHLPLASFLPTLQHLTSPCNSFLWNHVPNTDWGLAMLDLLPSPYSGTLLLTEGAGFASQNLPLAKGCCVLSRFARTSTCFITFSLHICSQSLVTAGGRQVVCGCLLLSLNADSKRTGG